MACACWMVRPSWSDCPGKVLPSRAHLWINLRLMVIPQLSDWLRYGSFSWLCLTKCAVTSPRASVPQGWVSGWTSLAVVKHCLASSLCFESGSFTWVMALWIYESRCWWFSTVAEHDLACVSACWFSSSEWWSSKSLSCPMISSSPLVPFRDGLCGEGALNFAFVGMRNALQRSVVTVWILRPFWSLKYRLERSLTRILIFHLLCRGGNLLVSSPGHSEISLMSLTVG